jgi:hypothetical protein
MCSLAIEWFDDVVEEARSSNDEGKQVLDRRNFVLLSSACLLMLSSLLAMIVEIVIVYNNKQ